MRKDMFSVFSWGKTGCLFKDLTEIPGIFIAYRLADVTDFPVGVCKHFFYFIHSYFRNIINKIFACFFFKKAA